MNTRVKTVKTSLIIMGILGYIVLLFPWYELNSYAYISGYGSSGGAYGTQIGLVTAYLATAGYGLYALPGVAIALGIGADSISQKLNTRAKALALEFIGIAELICLLLLNAEMGSYDADISGYGYNAGAGFEPISGYYIAIGTYILTGAVGFIMCIVAPKPQDEEAENAVEETTTTTYVPVVETPASWTCTYCNAENGGTRRQCRTCGLFKDFEKKEPTQRVLQPQKQNRSTQEFDTTTMTGKLAYALKFETDEGMISYLSKCDDETVTSILAGPREFVRANVEKTLEKLTKETPMVAEIVNGEKICPHCGFVQKIDRNVCWKCGQKFDN